MKMIAQDKANHYIIGNAIYGVARIWLAPLWCLGIVLLVAIGKEGRDKLGYGHASAGDIIATVAGGLTPYILEFFK